MDTPEEKDSMYLETDILPSLAGTDQVKHIFACEDKFDVQNLIFFDQYAKSLVI